jgi:hypothetical protein
METGYALLLPEGVCDYFTVIEVKKETERTVICLDELIIPPKNIAQRSFYLRAL